MIAILMGGNSHERTISLDSGEAVYASLQSQKIDSFKFDWCGDNLPLLWQKKFDKAFIALHGRGGEDGFIQAQLENRHIAFTGSGAIASKNCMDKAVSKKIWAKHQLPSPASILADKGQVPAKIPFPLPWAIKPIAEGSSLGISKVKDISELATALKLAWKYDSKALIEQWIEGEEYTVSILNGAALALVKIISADNFYDYQAKYHAHNTKYFCPSGLAKSTEKHLQNLALKAFEVLGATNWGRIDLMIDAQNKPYLLEINTVPGLTSHSLMPMAAKADGIDFNTLITRILKIEK